jgi:hypothetical protein
MNKFEKEYVTGRKDQFDVDYAIFKKAIDETETREELIIWYQNSLRISTTFLTCTSQRIL